MTGGMDNPVERRVHAERRAAVHGDVHRAPARLGRRDAIVHAIYGGVYGKPHDVIDGHPQTGDLMPVLSELGAAAPAGVDALHVERLRRRRTGTTSSWRSSTCRRSRATCSTPSGATFTSQGHRLRHVEQSRLPSDRRARGCRRQPARDRHGRLVQAVLPDVTAGQAGRARRHLSHQPPRRRRAAAIPRGRTLDWPTMTAVRLAQLLGDRAAGRPAAGDPAAREAVAPARPAC